MKLDLYIMIIS